MRRSTLEPVLIVETLLLAASAPFWLFPTRFPYATLGMLLISALWWAARWVIDGRTFSTSSFNGALLLWGVAVGVGTTVTAFPDLTLSKTAGLLLGLAAWRYLVIVVEDERRLRWAVAGFVAVGVSVAFIGVLSARWGAKVPGLQSLIEHLPPQVVSLPEAPERGVSANQLAGALVIYLPLVLSGFLGYILPERGSVTVDVQRENRWLRTVGIVGTFVGLAGLLILTQSRSGWVGGVAGVLVLALLWAFSGETRWPKWASLIIIVTLGVITTILLWRVGPDQIVALWDQHGGVDTEIVGQISLSGRVEIWSRALYAIQDFPFTGCGLGTFREVIWILYPLFTIESGSDIAHAHNMFLQVAVDTGLPGLIAYLALLGIAGTVGWRIAKRDRRLRPLALGLVAGLIALHVYGLTEALAPGSKPGLIFWLALGLLAVMERLSK
ncbi:MAG: O-antigen ligase family protein [Anaerolineae bacterium]